MKCFTKKMELHGQKYYKGYFSCHYEINWHLEWHRERYRSNWFGQSNMWQQQRKKLLQTVDTTNEWKSTGIQMLESCVSLSRAISTVHHRDKRAHHEYNNVLPAFLPIPPNVDQYTTQGRLNATKMEQSSAFYQTDWGKATGHNCRKFRSYW